MNQLADLLSFAAQLTRDDTKSLFAKYIKVGEEFGELGSVLLPYQNASGTLHRYVDRKNVVEEVADAMLALYSIVRSMDVPDEELLEMLFKKATKWQSIQINEKMIKDPEKIPYEIHVSIGLTEEGKELLNAPGYNLHPLFNPRTEKLFDELCSVLGVKSTRIELFNRNGNHLGYDWMTSSVHVGTNESANTEMERIANAITTWSFAKRHELNEGMPERHPPLIKVVRKKIETVPWHPAANQNSENCYFEKHWECLIDSDDFIPFCDQMHERDGIISKNLRKPDLDGKLLIGVTHRGRWTKLEFCQQCRILDHVLTQWGLIDSITEFAIYDSNVSHDAEWVKQSNLGSDPASW